MRGALQASYLEKEELENLVVNMEFDSFTLSGECAAILENAHADLLDVVGQGAFTVPGLSHPPLEHGDDSSREETLWLVGKRSVQIS